MTEHIPETDPHTGVEEVDDVLTSLRGLDDTPVEEHPAAFERAHDRLRQALDGPPAP
jgi:hypothetical protein